MTSSPSSSFPGSRWGPPLDEYLDYPEASLDFSYLPEARAVVAAINDLYHKAETVTYKTLETIMTITYRPRMMMLLLNRRAIASAMNLLETYAARDRSSNGGLFEHAFGFLGIHVLALILQAGMLHSFNGWLEKLPLILENGREYEWDTRAPALAPDFVLALLDHIIGAASTWAEANHMARYEFQWCADTWGAERACLPSVGGFTFRNAEFLLRQLFDNRNKFLKCCVRTGAVAWSILVFVLECHIREQSLGDRRVRALWRKQQDIAHRYSLVSGVGEDAFIEPICGSYFTSYHSEFEGRPSVVDIEDAQVIQEAYTRKFHPNDGETHPRDLGYALLVTWYARDNLANYPSLGLVAVETTMAVIWDVLLSVNDDVESRWADIDLFLGGNFGTFYQLLRSGDAGLISGAITLLHKIDVVNMLGRYLLLPCYLRNNVPNILDEAPDANPTTIRANGLMAINKTAEALEIAFKRAEAPRVLDDYYPDWYKMLIFLQQVLQLYSRVSYLHYLSTESEVAWMRLGSALGFTKHLSHNAGRYTCMYARCPSPVAARFESRSVRYCSARCQVAASLKREI
ncbi:hypothetical protein FRC08_007000 [Ceratobasidium sp. 394]|nr:hypothetical protein FRC08_007000 [Ceratobasidium sp. 394]